VPAPVEKSRHRKHGPKGGTKMAAAKAPAKDAKGAPAAGHEEAPAKKARHKRKAKVAEVQ
jgi:hypothetical protein